MEHFKDPGLFNEEMTPYPGVQLTQRFKPKDDWTGKSDPKERRKLQNRLNQRLWSEYYRISQAKSWASSLQRPIGTRHGLDVSKSRRRITQPKPGNGAEGSTIASSSQTIPISKASNMFTGLPESIQTVSVAEIEELGLSSAQAERVQSLPTLCNIPPVHRQHLIMRFNQRMHDSAIGSPRLDMLLTLVHFNVFRALVSNTLSMGFDGGWLTSDAISPFYEVGSCSIVHNFPPHLRPTALQYTVEHHPWIDLFPFPAMRDNLLAADGEYDEDMLCMDMVEFCHVPSEQTGLIVWGEPGDPRGWEVSDTFLAKWGWVLKGCSELLESTNYWREQRGEAGMVWEL